MIKTYAFPQGLEPNADYTVLLRHIDSEEIFKIDCYSTLTCNICIATGFAHNAPESLWRENMAFARFESDFSSPIEVTIIKRDRGFENADIRPRKLSVPFTRTGDRIRFVIHEPSRLSIEFDGDVYKNLFLWAEAPETQIIDPEGEKVLYFAPGVHDAGVISLTDGETLYIAGGAYVYGRIVCEKAENIKICGRGVLCGSKMPHDMNVGRPPLAAFTDCKNIFLKDIIMLDGSGWTAAFYRCEDVRIEGICQITNYYNGDGVDICSCRNFHAENMFLRNFDDCISVKSKGPDNEHIVIRDSILWNDCAHSMLIGPESPPEAESRFQDILFENITVLKAQSHNPTFFGVMALMCTDDATFRNITWRNITIERLDGGNIVSFRYQTAYSEKGIGKRIENITVENVDFHGAVTAKSTLFGEDDEHRIRNAVIRNFRVNGVRQTSLLPYFQIDDFADVTVE